LEGAVHFRGQIDLLSVFPDETVVVDLKTGAPATEADACREADHWGYYDQLSVYAIAASRMYRRPVSAWLFFTGSGRALQVIDAQALPNGARHVSTATADLARTVAPLAEGVDIAFALTAS